MTWMGRLVAGVDIEVESAGSSLLSRFEEGEIGPAAPDLDALHEEFCAWFRGRHGTHAPPAGLQAFVAEAPEGPREPWRVLVGVLVSEMPLDGRPAETLSVEECEDALAESRKLFAAWGVRANPGIHLIFSTRG